MTRSGTVGLTPECSPSAPWPGTRELRDDEVHVFCADMESLSPLLKSCLGLLSVPERERASKFAFENDRNAHILARGMLRAILGCYTGADPETLRFDQGPFGKPMLDGTVNPRSFRFNVSHSGRLVVCAVARGREIGVDVECIRPEFPYQEIIERFFSPREAESIRSLPEHHRNQAFYSYWTLKEALMKATGRGLFLPPDQLEVALEPPRVLCMQGDSLAGLRWSVRQIDLGNEYSAAVAAEGRNLHIRHRNLVHSSVVPDQG